MSNEINLFSYNITDKDNKYTLDDNPFISRRISSSLQEKLDEQSAVLQKNFKKHLSGTMLLGTLIIVGILTSIFSLILRPKRASGCFVLKRHIATLSAIWQTTNGSCRGRRM